MGQLFLTDPNSSMYLCPITHRVHSSFPSLSLVLPGLHFSHFASMYPYPGWQSPLMHAGSTQGLGGSWPSQTPTAVERIIQSKAPGSKAAKTFPQNLRGNRFTMRVGRTREQNDIMSEFPANAAAKRSLMRVSQDSNVHKKTQKQLVQQEGGLGMS